MQHDLVLKNARIDDEKGLVDIGVMEGRIRRIGSGLKGKHIIDVEGDVLKGQAKNLDGDVFDRFAIRKRPDGTRVWEGLPMAPIFLVGNEPRSY